MADIWSKKKRSEVMGKVRSKENRSTELRLVEILRESGITGWRRNQKLPGKPDFVFRKARVAIFVDGCFWHGCPDCYRRPKSNRKFWDGKVSQNRYRDWQVTRILRQNGWRVVRIWEHQLGARRRVAARIQRAIKAERDCAAATEN